MFQIDSLSRRPVYEQIVEQAERFILLGVLAADAQLPSVRSLSLSLAINPNTIQKAFAELDRRGLIYAVPGIGNFVSPDAKEKLSEHKRRKLDDLSALVTELALAGVTKDELFTCIEGIYQEKEESV